jgi:hypothetical protein
MSSLGEWRLLCSHHVGMIELECQCGEGAGQVVISGRIR